MDISQGEESFRLSTQAARPIRGCSASLEGSNVQEGDFKLHVLVSSTPSKSSKKTFDLGLQLMYCTL